MTQPPEPTRDKIGRAVVRGNWILIGAGIAIAIAAAALIAAALIVGRT